ncbi:DUF7289 family protein [Haloglomus litoreum]|uniref:DUF7289 family protein n=1 Tax=Haloglomus litoreum TaxID=3034026 RepID=UPI0023E8CA9C|nr:Ig-like domain-containing protein [Haloglomus sp. DT116]
MENRIYSDNRCVSEIIGAILVFGLVVISLALFQTTAVPASNEEVEFDHNQEAQTDLLGLDAELNDAAASGNGGTAVVTIGTDYPSRFLFRNPPPVSGSLTAETSRFSIDNAVAVGDTETDDYWDGDPTDPYESRRLVYRVDYNVYEEAPETVLSHGVVYDRFDDGPTRRIDAGGFIDGRSIELTALAGRRNESRVGAVSVPVTAQAAPTETVRVSGAGNENIRLTLRTAATPAEWRDFLEDEMTDGHVEDVVAGDDPGTVEVVLEEGITYELELARVAVGSAPYDAAPAYVTTSDPTTQSVTVGEPSDLTVQVRDAYNGPVAGEDVTFTVDDGRGAPTTETVTTGGEGEATLSYTPSVAGPVEVTAVAGAGTGTDGDPLSVVYDLTASLPGTGEDTEGSGGELNPGGSDAFTLSTASIVNCTPPDTSQRTVVLTDSNCRVDVTFENRGRARTITAVRVNVYSAGQAYPIPNPNPGGGGGGGGGGSQGKPLPRPRPDEWSFQGSADQDFAEGGLTLSSPLSVPADTAAPYGTHTYRFEFDVTDSTFGVSDQQYNVVEGDFYVLTLRFSDGSTSSYLVAPQD